MFVHFCTDQNLGTRFRTTLLKERKRKFWDQTTMNRRTPVITVEVMDGFH
jgi:hypothetical protein